MKEAKQTTPMTFAELVDNTVEHYTNNPRSRKWGSGPYAYAGPNGERCAAARMCDESLTNFREMDNACDSSWYQVSELAILKPEYAHFGNAQIYALQNLHDKNENWLNPDGLTGTGGLSETGKQFVESIKSKFKNP